MTPIASNTPEPKKVQRKSGLPFRLSSTPGPRMATLTTITTILSNKDVREETSVQAQHLYQTRKKSTKSLRKKKKEKKKKVRETNLIRAKVEALLNFSISL